MGALFEILDHQPTPMGDISLRRRRDPRLDLDVYEVKLGDEYLMSSLFPEAERALASLALDRVGGNDLQVVVGGLGLGYTALTALEGPQVRSLWVIEALGEVVSWHQRSLLPDAQDLATDPRCHLVHGDFFAFAQGELSVGPDTGLDAVLLDIDHSPTRLLAQGHREFYTADGLARLCSRLRPGGVFGLWSDDPPDERFGALLDESFDSWQADVIEFENPLIEGTSTNTVYLATAP